MKLRPAQVLVELMLAFAVAMVAILALVQSSTKSLSNATVSKYETQATQYANEAIDWLRAQKNVNWINFNNRKSNRYYCLNTIDWNTTGDCGNTTMTTSFGRYVDLYGSDDTVIKAKVVVKRDGKDISIQNIEFRNY